MNSKKDGYVAIYVGLLLATLAVMIGVALALYPPAERTDSFMLSLVALCFAATLLFLFPIYHARAAADRREPAVAFGFGFQAALVIYALGVVLLCVLRSVGTLGYSLEERATTSSGANVERASARSDSPVRQEFDGTRKVELVVDRALPAGATDHLELEGTLRLDPGQAARAIDCSSVGLVSSSLLHTGDGSRQVASCLGNAEEVVQVGDLEVRKSLVGSPRPRADASGLFDFRYRIEVHNTRWFASFRTLAIAHSIWFLLLLLTAGVWRIGSAHATRTSTRVREQRHEFNEIRGRYGAFASAVMIDREPAMQPFVEALASLKDDVSYASPETLPGTESYNGALLAALEKLSAEYHRVRALIAGAHPVDRDVEALGRQARSIASLVRERDAAIRAAR